LGTEWNQGVGLFKILANLSVVRVALYQDSPAASFLGIAISSYYSDIAIASSNTGLIYLLKVDV
jgi:hypothetical protein